MPRSIGSPPALGPFGAAFRASGPARCRPSVVRQRFKDEILHDVAHDLVPRAVDEALASASARPGRHAGRPGRRRRGGKPLTFTATFDDGAAVRPGRLPRDRAAQAAGRGRRRRPWTRRWSGCASGPRASSRSRAGRSRASDWADGGPGRGEVLERRPAAGPRETHTDVTIELGAPANPPGFDEQLVGPRAGRGEDVHGDLPGRLRAWRSWPAPTVEYAVTVKGVKRRVVPGAGRRVREGPRRLRVARGAARRACAHDLRARGAARGGPRGARRPADGAGGAGAASTVPDVAGRARAGPPGRGVRAAADRAAGRSAEGRHRLERVPRRRSATRPSTR